MEFLELLQTTDSLYDVIFGSSIRTWVFHKTYDDKEDIFREEYDAPLAEQIQYKLKPGGRFLDSVIGIKQLPYPLLSPDLYKGQISNHKNSVLGEIAVLIQN